ncbi:MAG: electron transport complex subunit RsxA [Lentimicrobiaceae bacterium]|nr:electron transport complex subunit RsxA [Lentimicrobiaceae bacterium]
MDIIKIIIVALLVNNVVLVQFLGICPFLGVSNKVNTSLGMGMAVVFVMAMANLVTYLVHNFILIPLHIEFLQTISFILIIAFLVQVVEIILKKSAPALYQALGIFLPLITTNCAVLGIAILAIQKDFNLIESVVYSSATALGFTLALVLLAGIREQLELVAIPEKMKGHPIVLITAGLLSMAFMGFAGLIK